MNSAWKRNIYAAGLLILSGLIMSVWAGCAINPVSGRPELTLISEKFEQELGDEEAKKIEAGMGFADDTGFTPFLNQLGQRLAEHSPRKNVSSLQPSAAQPAAPQKPVGAGAALITVVPGLAPLMAL